MSDAAYGDDHREQRLAEERRREDEKKRVEAQKEAERLAKLPLGMEVEITISGEDLQEMLRECVRQLLVKHGLEKSLGHVVSEMRLQINRSGPFVDLKDPIRFSNKK